MTAMPKKVLVLTSTLPRWVGDTEPRFVEYLSYKLARHFEIVILAPHCPGAARHEVFSHGNQSVTVHRFRYCLTALESLAYQGGILSRLRRNPLRLLLVPFFLIAELISIAKLQREYHFDAIHAHWIIPQGLVAAVYGSLASKAPPILVTSHGGDLYALRGALLTRLKRWVLKKASRVTVVSAAMRDNVNELGCGADNVRVQSMGVDLQSTFTPGDSAANRAGLIFVGRLVEKKGVRFLIEAMALLVDRFPELRLTIIGDGPLRNELSGLAEKLRVASYVHFAGSVPNVELPEQLRQAQVAVMPSVIAESGDQEGLGLVAIEAMGCGCAVVASALPAIRDTVIDGETGLMARPGDTADLAAKVTVLLENDAMRQQLAQAGRRYALDYFDWQHVGDNYAGIIKDML